MSSVKSPDPQVRPVAKKTGTRIAIFLGLGLGFSGELAGSAWLGWWIGSWWQLRGGPKSAPGMAAAALVVLALAHVIWLLWRIAAAQERGERIGEDS